MKIEHFALNVEDALSTARWYVEHLGLTVKRRVMEAPWAHFLADDSGTVMIEIYSNTTVELADYRNTDPLAMHLALVSNNVEADVARLISAGASQVGGSALGAVLPPPPPMPTEGGADDHDDTW